MIDFVSTLGNQPFQSLESGSGSLTLQEIGSYANLVTPKSAWYNGATYITGQRDDTVNNAPSITKWKDGNFEYSEFGSIDSNDPLDHTHFAVVVIDGFIYCIGVNGHGDEMRIYKSDFAEDISTFSLLHAIPGDWGYANVSYIDKRLVILTRLTDNGAANIMSQVVLRSAVDDFTTWETLQTTFPDYNNTSIRHYPATPIYYGDNNWLYFFNQLRIDTSPEVYFGIAPYKTPITGAESCKVFYSMDESFSKDVFTNGPLTPSEIEDNLMIVGSINDNQQPVDGANMVVINDVLYGSYYNYFKDRYALIKIENGFITEEIDFVKAEPSTIQITGVVIRFNGYNLVFYTAGKIYTCDLNYEKFNEIGDLAAISGLNRFSVPYNLWDVEGVYITRISVDGADINYVITDDIYLLNVEDVVVTPTEYIFPLQNVVANFLFNKSIYDDINDHSGTATDIKYMPQGRLGYLADMTLEPTSTISVPSIDAYNFSKGVVEKPFTIIGVISYELFDSSFRILAKKLDQFQAYFVSNQIYIRIYDSVLGGYIGRFCSYQIPKKELTHIALSYKGTGNPLDFEIHINGVKFNTAQSISGSFLRMRENSNSLEIFSRTSDNVGTIPGFGDNLILVDDFLTTAQIQNAYNLYLENRPITDATPEPPLVAFPVADLISYWEFDTDFTDSIGSNDGVGSNVSLVTGVIGNAVDFTAGTSSNVEVADDDSLSFGSGSFTFMTWVNLSSLDSSIMFSKRNNDSSLREYLFIYNTSFGWLFRMFQSGNNSIYRDVKCNTAEPVLDRWNHVAVSYNGTTGTIYINGTAQTTTNSDTGAYTTMANTDSSLMLGRYQNITNSGLDGLMDESAILGKACTSEEIKTAYRKGINGLKLTE